MVEEARAGFTSGANIRDMFSRLVPEYDRFNRISSLGLDDLWRDRLLREVPSGRLLDVGAGTGAVARRAAGRSVGTDFSFAMLERARRLDPAVPWVQASADRLPFAEGRFDGVVSAYVMRNLFKAGVLGESLHECRRVLRPGGRLAFLDLTRPNNALVRWGHALYARTVVPAVGRVLFGDRWPGEYLRRSIEELPSAAALKALFEESGLRGFAVRPLAGGIVSLFCAEK